MEFEIGTTFQIVYCELEVPLSDAMELLVVNIFQYDMYSNFFPGMIFIPVFVLWKVLPSPFRTSRANNNIPLYVVWSIFHCHISPKVIENRTQR